MSRARLAANAGLKCVGEKSGKNQEKIGKKSGKNREHKSIDFQQYRQKQASFAPVIGEKSGKNQEKIGKKSGKNREKIAPRRAKIGNNLPVFQHLVLRTDHQLAYNQKNAHFPFCSFPPGCPCHLAARHTAKRR